MSDLVAYVGSRTTRERNARGEGISVYRVEGASGALERIQLVSDLAPNPSFLALNRDRTRLYTVHGDGHEVSVLAIDPATGLLHFLQRQQIGGRNPVHLALDPTERWMVVSDHLGDPAQPGGTLAVLPVAADGRLGDVQQRVPMPGTPGPHRKEQAFAKPHFNPFDPSGRHVLVPDKGLDRVFSFRFEGGRLTPNAQPWLQTREGAGPRHIAFHPTAPWAYVVNELDSSVMACRLDAATGALDAFQVLTTLPEDFIGHSHAAEIEVARDGRRVYASNRGCDGIAVYDIDMATGRLAWRGLVPSGGRTPRFFTCTPDGRWMFVLNEDSDSIATFALGEGMPTQVGEAVGCGSPVCMVFGAGSH